jgi:hypothetical protein
MGEDPLIDIFDAAALVLMVGTRGGSRIAANTQIG